MYIDLSKTSRILIITNKNDSKNFLINLSSKIPMIFNHFSLETQQQLKELLDNQQLLAKTNYPTLIPIKTIVFTMFNYEMYNNPLIKKLIFSNRFYKINCIFIMEKHFNLPKSIKSNMDYIYILNDLLLEKKERNKQREKIFVHFDSFFLSFFDLNSFFDRIFNEEKTVLLDNSSIDFKVHEVS
jgi:hypothetical protein